MVTILGTGLLGSGFARALLRRGEEVHLWNRTLERAKPLEADGARVHADAAEAVRGASRVHVVVSDDAAVDGVLTTAALDRGTLVVDHTTTSTEGARRRTAREDIVYVHAPVFMGPQNALESTGLMLVSGDRARVERVTPLLTPMTGKLIDLGERVDAAAAFKLMGNTFLMGFTAAIADMLGLGKALGFSVEEVLPLFSNFNPWTTIAARARRVGSGRYDAPSWELAMARKDARLVEGEMEAAHAQAPLLLVAAITEAMDRMIAAGHAHADWTVISKDLVGS
jgi:3-hydroxyisobutyrate dehydrogenase